MLQTFATSTPINDDVISLIGAGTVCQAKRYLVKNPLQLDQPPENKRKMYITKDNYGEKVAKIVCIIIIRTNDQIETNHPKSKTKRITMTKKKEWAPKKSERAMIEGIIEGSPDAIGVAVIRLDCGCRKMAAIDKNGEPASKIIMYRDMAESICDQCQKDNGDFMRVTEQFISWAKPEPDAQTQETITAKVLGTTSEH